MPLILALRKRPSLVCKLSSRTARAVPQRDPVLKKPLPPKKKKNGKEEDRMRGREKEREEERRRRRGLPFTGFWCPESSLRCYMW